MEVCMRKFICNHPRCWCALRTCLSSPSCPLWSRRALYGLKQAPRAWFEHFVFMIRAVGFAPSDHDPTLFIHLPPRRRSLLPYAEDMLITGDDLEHINHDKKQLGKKFQISDLGPLSYFLWIEFLYSAKGYCISQFKYIQDLVARSRITENRKVQHLWIFTCSFLLLMVHLLKTHLDIDILCVVLFISL